MVKKDPENKVQQYKGLFYGQNGKGDYVVLPFNENDVNSPSAFPVVPAFCQIETEEKEKRAREHIDFITTVDEGGYYIAENVSTKGTELGNGPKVSWWVCVRNRAFFIADTSGEKIYPRPREHEWKKATAEQVGLLKKISLVRVV